MGKDHAKCKTTRCKKLRDNKNKCSAIIDCTIQGLKTKALIDTGAQISLMSHKLYSQLDPKLELTKKLKLEGIVPDMKMEAKLCEGINVSFQDKQTYTWGFYVANITEPVIIGIDFLCHFKALLNFGQCTLTLNNCTLPIEEFRSENGDLYSVSLVLVSEKMEIPPNTVFRTFAQVQGCIQGAAVISSSGKNKGALLPNTLVTIPQSH